MSSKLWVKGSEFWVLGSELAYALHMDTYRIAIGYL